MDFEPETINAEKKKEAAKVQERERQKMVRQDESEETTPGAPVRPKTRTI